MTVTQEKLIHALNNGIRLSILESLKVGPKNVSELVKIVGAGQSNVSQHLACLRGCSLIRQSRQGKYYYYELVNGEVTHFLDEMAVVIKSLNWQDDQTSVACEHHMP